MEVRLIIAGAVLFAYAYACRTLRDRGALDTRLRGAAWHALFCGMAGFLVTMIAVLSVESRVRFVSATPGVFDLREMVHNLLGGLLAAGFGFWRAWRGGAKAEKRKYYLNEDLEWSETIYSALLLAGLLMYFVVQAFKIPSGSMKDTLLIGDHLFVNKFIYGVRVPFSGRRLLRLSAVGRGDIVVFRFPTDDPESEHCGTPQYGKDFIKRVIGLPGDKVEVRDGLVLVDGKALQDEPYAKYMPGEGRNPRPLPEPAPEEYQRLWERGELDRRLSDAMKDNFGPVTVPADSYLVMGDNRDRSCDGRFWGPVHERYLKGKAWVIYWPPGRMGGIR